MSRPYENDVNEKYFDNIDTEEKAYWLGFLTADGCIIDSQNGANILKLGLGRVDRNHIELFNKSVGSTYKIYDGVNNTNSEYSNIAISSYKLCNRLIELGVVPRKSFIVEPWVGPKEMMKHYWRGIFDGDGCLSLNKKSKWVLNITGSNDICNGFRNYIKDTLITIPSLLYPEISPHGNVYQINYSAIMDVKKVMDLMYKNSTVSLERKKVLYNKLLSFIKDNYTGDWIL